MGTTETFTVSLPPAMAEQLERVRKVEHRTRSGLMREALREYFYSRFPAVQPARAELSAIRKGRAEIKRGEFVTLERLLNDMGTPNRKPGKKRVRKSSR